jgi:PRC-barrel domain protein
MAEELVADSRTERVETPEEAVDYAHELISSRRVEGTAVYGASGEKLGSIHSVMIGKRSGQVAYAVLSAGGWLGTALRAHVHPIPWALLTYDVDRDGYVVDLTRERLEAAPSMTLDETDRPIDRDYQERVSSYWGTMPWWGL